MTEIAQAKITELDISERLRVLMREHKLSVSDIATVAGVSKSAMEKYLAGPSSPRATAIASICSELSANAHWLLFGTPDDELRIIRSVVDDVLVDLLNELKQGGEIAQPFAKNDFGTRDWRMFTWELADQRSREAIERIVRAREKALEDARQGLGGTVALGPFPIRSDKP